jgi:death-on-curing protein
MITGEPRWLSLELLLTVHERQIAEHGGGEGIRDRGLLESALARPRQQFAYGGPEVDLPALAAALGFGIARNHPFVDGNKRTAYVAMRLFLRINGWDFAATPADRYRIMIQLASGTLQEPELTAWLRDHTRPDAVSESPAHYA